MPRIVAIDLGTDTTRICGPAAGRVVEAPTAAVAEPLRGGVVVDVEAAARLLRPLLGRLRWFGFLPRRALVCVPSDASPDERAALVDATERAGPSVGAVVPELRAAAVGAGVDVGAPHAQMVVDVGHGVTDAGVFRDGRLVATAAVRFAGRDVQDAVAAAVREDAGLCLARRDAADACLRLDAWRARPEAAVRVRGDDARTRRPRDASLAAHRVLAAADMAVARIVADVAEAVRRLPPELGCEVLESGIRLTGGGAHLDGLAERLAEATAIPVTVAPEPRYAVIRGAREILSFAAVHAIWDR